MTADNENINTAHALVLVIEDIATSGRQDEETAERLVRAIMRLEDTCCESISDALAFIAIAYRVMNTEMDALSAGASGESESREAIDRYLLRAAEFLHRYEARDAALLFPSTTFH